MINSSYFARPRGFSLINTTGVVAFGPFPADKILIRNAVVLVSSADAALAGVLTYRHGNFSAIPADAAEFDVHVDASMDSVINLLSQVIANPFEVYIPVNHIVRPEAPYFCVRLAETGNAVTLTGFVGLDIAYREKGWSSPP